MADDSVVIERHFDAPVDLVWKMWTDAEHFKAWYGPAGATIPSATIDVRVGGSRLICMEVTTPGGPRQMWFGGEHREVIENELLVYTESMTDEHGNIASPAETGMPADHPATTEVRVQLEDVNGGTKMVMTHIGVPADSPGAAGWNMAFDKLAPNWPDCPGARSSGWSGGVRVHASRRNQHGGSPLAAHRPVVGIPIVVGTPCGGEDPAEQQPEALLIDVGVWVVGSDELGVAFYRGPLPAGP